MWQQSDLQVPALLKFPVYALFSWTEASDSVVRPVLYSLKAGRCEQAMESLANEFSWRYSGSKTQPTFFIPQSKTGKPDHAEAWARSLSGIWSAAEPSPLCFSDLNQAGVQKRLTAKERLARSFTQVKNAKSLAQRKVVFADDILTTGATAQAAYKALGEPPHFEVWAIAWRPKLAREERF